jgi:Domain of unknown function (DUF4214)
MKQSRRVAATNVVLRLERLEDRTVPTAVSFTSQVVPAGAMQIAPYVNAAYEKLLGQSADPAGLTFWSTLLDQGLSRPQFIQFLEVTPQFDAAVTFGLYGRYLGRSPEPAGLAASVQYLQSGGTTLGLSTAIIGSSEFIQLHGGTNAGFLNGVYEDVLNRLADPGALIEYGQQLAAGLSRFQVVREIATTPEADVNVVADLYLQFLDRPADPSGLIFWSTQMVNGAPVEAVIQGIVGSPEVIISAELDF